jgi:phosphotransferase system  glucose/maltose/N-acetylglucosamine-specific IIC component
MKCLRLFIILTFLQATSSQAAPVLSADEVDVGDALYDVLFNDGVFAAGVTFNATREAEATAVSAAVVAAWNLVGTFLPAYSVGCASTPSCNQFTPRIDDPSRYVDFGLSGRGTTGPCF